MLVLRDTHSVSLTPDGEAMIGFARTILASYGEAERLLQRAPSPAAGCGSACPTTSR